MQSVFQTVLLTAKEFPSINSSDVKLIRTCAGADNYAQLLYKNYSYVRSQIFTAIKFVQIRFKENTFISLTIEDIHCTRGTYQ